MIVARDPLVLRVRPNGQVLARNCKVCGAVFALGSRKYKAA